MRSIACTCWSVSLALVAAFGVPVAAQQPRIVFVCEHGTVKSLVALEYFTRYARERGLRMDAISRGTRPDSAVPSVVASGLRSDGFDLRGFRPQKFTPLDLSGALLVVALDANIDSVVEGTRTVARWDGMPSVMVSYATGRRAIERRVRRLVDSLSAGRR